MRSLFLSAFLIVLPLCGAEAPRTYPLRDGREPVETYARRVNLPATKQLDLGSGVTLDLVLIPAGRFVMGTPEPVPPGDKEVEALILIWIGMPLATLLLLILLMDSIENRRLAFSLRWFFLMMIASGMFIGGIARKKLAFDEQVRYFDELAEFRTHSTDEIPAHSVTISQPFYMGKYTVTQAQYEAVTGDNPSLYIGSELPVETVSWHTAKEFCARLNEQLHAQGLKACLPTEAQWEFACRAGTSTRFYSGDSESDLDAVAWFAKNSGRITHPVGEKKPNAFGLFDMHGNVWNWCADAKMDYDDKEAIDPLNEQGVARVLRGGSLARAPEHCRSAHRRFEPPTHQMYSIGIRVVVPPSNIPRPGHQGK